MWLCSAQLVIIIIIKPGQVYHLGGGGMKNSYGPDEVFMEGARQGLPTWGGGRPGMTTWGEGLQGTVMIEMILAMVEC